MKGEADGARLELEVYVLNAIMVELENGLMEASFDNYPFNWEAIQKENDILDRLSDSSSL